MSRMFVLLFFIMPESLSEHILLQRPDGYLHNTVSGMQDNKLYLLLFDADKFKQINNTYGHPEGDRAMQLIAKAIMSVCHGTSWFCARYGGDEHVIIMPLR